MQPNNKSIYNDRWDDWFDQKVYGPASRWLRWLIEGNLSYADLSLIRSVIDVGCGQGTTTELIARLLPGAGVLGIDFSDTGINAARRRYSLPNLAFEVDESSVRLEPDAYDLVTCFEVLEHVPEWELLLQRICQASRRYVMLSFPTGRMRRFESVVGHVRNFQRGQVEKFMARAGFSEANVYYAGFPFFSPLYRNFCNVTNAGQNDFASGRFGYAQKAVSLLIFVMFRYLSVKRRGDQFCGLFKRQ